MWEILHFFFRETGSLPTLDPWPGLHISNAVFALAEASEILALFTCVLSAESDLEDTEDTKSFLLESVDGIYNA